MEKSINLDGETDADRRISGRWRVFKGATLSFNRGYGALECVVRNESETGALLAFGETSAVPAVFDIAIKGSATRRAAVRWRDLRNVGIEFA